MKAEQREGSAQPSFKGAPLFISCPGCNAVVAATSKVCKICRHSLHEKSSAKLAALKKTKKRKRPDVEQAAEKGKDQQSQDASDEASSAGESIESSSASSSNDGDGNADSKADNGSEAKKRRGDTNHATAQPGEKLDCSPFDNSRKGYTHPMVEIKAGLNVWHQVRVHKETANELRIAYPGKDDSVTKEWLKRTSSRFWRGPMAQRFWVCTDKTLGHWRPKAADETEKAKKGSKRRKGSAGRQPKARRASGGHGETTEGTGTQTGASMGPYSGAEEEQRDTPKQASTEQPAAQDLAEASSKPVQQNAEAGSSEPALPAKGPGRPGRKEEPVVHGEVEPAIHSNSEEQGPHQRAGSMPGISSKDEAEALNADAPLAEAEQGAALAAWFKVHYAKLDEQGLLFTHLGGAGPEVGVRQKHLSSDVTPQQQRREYDFIKGWAVRNAPGDAPAVKLEEGDWLLQSLNRPGSGPIVSNGATMDRALPAPAPGQRQPGASSTQQAACLKASRQRGEIVDCLASKSSGTQPIAEQSAQSGGRQQRLNGVSEPGSMNKAHKKDAVSSFHKQEPGASREGSKAKPAGQGQRQTGPQCKHSPVKSPQKGGSKLPSKPKAGHGHSGGAGTAVSPKRQPQKGAAASAKGTGSAQRPQLQQPAPLKLEPTDLFL